MNRPGVWKIIAFSSSVLLLFVYSRWWQQMITDPERSRGTDFISFYAVGRIAQTSGMSSIYNIDLQREMEHEVVGSALPDDRVLLFIHPPQLVPLLALIINENYATSFMRWGILLIGIYLIATACLVQALFRADDSFQKIGLIGVVLTFLPLYISIWQGQDTAFLFVGVILWCVGLLTKHEWLIAVGVAFTTIRPHISIVVTLPLLFHYRKAFWRSILVAGTVTAASMLLLGATGVRDLLQLIHISAEGEWFGINPGGMLNLLGIAARGPWRLSPQSLSALGWIIFAGGGWLIALLWARSSAITERLLGLTILIALLTAPHLHLHDLTPSLLPILIILKMERLALRQLPISVPLLGISLLWLAGFLTPGLYFIVPYLLCLLLAWRLQKQHASFNH